MKTPDAADVFADFETVMHRLISSCAAQPTSYTFGMKTAISIPDDVFADADKLARDLKQSRSQLYSRAVREYVARHSADSVTAALDAVYAEEPVADDGFLAAAARRTLERTEW
jgi:predicted transcriptional regulator